MGSSFALRTDIYGTGHGDDAEINLNFCFFKIQVKWCKKGVVSYGRHIS